MEWSGQGLILSMRKHGETSAIIDVLTAEKGRHAGVVRGGASRRVAPILQPGAQVAVEWRARLEEHLGSYKVEPIRARAGLMSDRLALSALGSVCAIASFAFPERMALPHLYARTVDLVDRMETGSGFAAAYAHWEMAVLDDLGYGLDLSECAVTGSTQELIYVSPKSGRAVSREAAGEWADRMLPLPTFLRMQEDCDVFAEVLSSLQTTGYFLQSWLAPALGNRPLPEARDRFVAALQKRSV